MNMKYFGTMSLRRILGYRWRDGMSNAVVIMKARLTHVTCILLERQLHLYVRVVRLPAQHPPSVTFLSRFAARQGGPTISLAMARRRPDGYRRGWTRRRTALSYAIIRDQL